MNLRPPQSHGNGYPSASDLAAQLAQRRRHWLPIYYPSGRLEGGMFLLGDADGSPGRSLPIPLADKKRSFKDFSTGERLDDLDLLARALRTDMRTAYAEALRILGFDKRPASSGRGTLKAAQPRRPPPPQAAASVPNDHNQARAQALWREAHPLCDCETCEPGRRYLAMVRDITSWPEALFFHAYCPSPVGTGPALLAPVNDAQTGYVVGVRRIRLTPAGEKIGRFGLGPTAGNCSRLYWPGGDQVAVCEGVEDSIAQHLLSEGMLPCWAALSATNMAALILPDRLRRITVIPDSDEPGRIGAQRLASRLQREGRAVEILAARGSKDPNALLQRKQRR